LLYGIALDEDVVIGDDEDAIAGPNYMYANAVGEDGIEIVVHCSDECPEYFVAIEGTVTVANRGYPQRVTTHTPGSGWDKRLRDFCKKYKLPVRGAPGWYLASMWG